MAFILVCTLFAGIAFWTTKQFPSPKAPTISIGDDVVLNIEVVSDPTTQAKGLGERESLPEESGMLFVFSRPKMQNFWMKGMLIPLDVVWINDFKVIGVSQNILPPAQTEGKIERMASPSAADMVLEINAGLVEKLGIQVGDEVNIDKN